MSDKVVIEATGWPTPPGPTPEALNRVFGKFAYQELAKGNIRVIDDWERNNIVTVSIRVRGPKKKRSVQLHHAIVPMFSDLMAVIFEAYPGYHINQLGGYCPRHKMHDPDRGLSIHSWGVAVDINWKDNPVSHELITDFPEGLPEIFEGAGWNWGGRWRQVKDSMHFQFTKGA